MLTKDRPSDQHLAGEDRKTAQLHEYDEEEDRTSITDEDFCIKTTEKEEEEGKLWHETPYSVFDCSDVENLFKQKARSESPPLPVAGAATRFHLTESRSDARMNIPPPKSSVTSLTKARSVHAHYEEGLTQPLPPPPPPPPETPAAPTRVCRAWTRQTARKSIPAVLPVMQQDSVITGSNAPIIISAGPAINRSSTQPQASQMEMSDSGPFNVSDESMLLHSLSGGEDVSIPYEYREQQRQSQKYMQPVLDESGSSGIFGSDLKHTPQSVKGSREHPTAANVKLPVLMHSLEPKPPISSSATPDVMSDFLASDDAERSLFSVESGAFTQLEGRPLVQAPPEVPPSSIKIQSGPLPVRLHGGFSFGAPQPPPPPPPQSQQQSAFVSYTAPTPLSLAPAFGGSQGAFAGSRGAFGFCTAAQQTPWHFGSDTPPPAASHASAFGAPSPSLKVGLRAPPLAQPHALAFGAPSPSPEVGFDGLSPPVPAALDGSAVLQKAQKPQGLRPFAPSQPTQMQLDCFGHSLSSSLIAAAPTPGVAPPSMRSSFLTPLSRVQSTLAAAQGTKLDAAFDMQSKAYGMIKTDQSQETPAISPLQKMQSVKKMGKTSPQPPDVLMKPDMCEGLAGPLNMTNTTSIPQPAKPMPSVGWMQLHRSAPKQHVDAITTQQAKFGRDGVESFTSGQGEVEDKTSGWQSHVSWRQMGGPVLCSITDSNHRGSAADESTKQLTHKMKKKKQAAA